MNMKYEIQSVDGLILFSLETNSLSLCVEAAVKARADLSDAYLSGADLSDADLSDANLRWAYLSDANLRCAYLGGADLSAACLRGADLSGAYLSGADLRGADLSGANLRGAKNIPVLADAESRILPEGNLVGWKKCRDNVIVKLLIPQKAKRSNATGRKCRAEYVDVIRVYGASEGISQYTKQVVYRAGETVRCDEWNSDRWVECGGGIHFFLTREEAEAH